MWHKWDVSLDGLVQPCNVCTANMDATAMVDLLLESIYYPVKYLVAICFLITFQILFKSLSKS